MQVFLNLGNFGLLLISLILPPALNLHLHSLKVRYISIAFYSVSMCTLVSFSTSNYCIACFYVGAGAFKGAIVDFCLLVQIICKICRTWFKKQQKNNGASLDLSKENWENLFGNLTSGLKCLFVCRQLLRSWGWSFVHTNRNHSNFVHLLTFRDLIWKNKTIIIMQF